MHVDAAVTAHLHHHTEKLSCVGHVDYAFGFAAAQAFARGRKALPAQAQVGTYTCPRATGCMVEENFVPWRSSRFNE